VKAALWLVAGVCFGAVAACGGRSIDQEQAAAHGGAAGEHGASAGTGGGAGAGGGASLSDCDALHAEMMRVRSCSRTSECGQLIEDWPGCSAGVVPERMPPVVRNDAELTELRRLLGDAAGDTDCRPSAFCPCPVVDAILCLSGICQWRAVDCGPPPR